MVVGLALVALATSGVFRSPDAAMRAFLAPDRQVGEDQLADPLILTGTRAVPLVAASVRDRQLRYRRYALAYLGWAQDERALPVLRSIVEDSSEHDYFRADALEAIACIRVGSGDSLAARFAKDTGLVGRTASQVFDGPFCPPGDRTFWDAFVGRHE
jgi:HEAT repeat protein